MRLLCWSLWSSYIGVVVRGNGDKHQPKNSVSDFEEEIGFYQAVQVTDDSPVYSTKSEFQDIQVYKSKYYGKILLLDGVIQVRRTVHHIRLCFTCHSTSDTVFNLSQLTETDADSYNEMMAQVAMMRHQNPKRALIIGGGDGYVLSEVRPCR